MIKNIVKSENIVITDTVKKIDEKYYVEIPESILFLMEIDEKSILETNIKKLEHINKIDYDEMIKEKE